MNMLAFFVSELHSNMNSDEVHASRTPNEIKGTKIRSNGIRQASFWMINTKRNGLQVLFGQHSPDNLLRCSHAMREKAQRAAFKWATMTTQEGTAFACPVLSATIHAISAQSFLQPYTGHCNRGKSAGKFKPFSTASQQEQPQSLQRQQPLFPHPGHMLPWLGA